MASLSEYLKSTAPQRDANTEALLKSISGYQANRDVLTALGAPDTKKNAALGLLSGILKPLSVPGNLLRAGALELIGRPTAELQGVSGLQELAQLAKGNIQVGAGELPFLQTKPGEGFLPRVAKLGGALALDVATDPLSYITAPASISRKAASTLLLKNVMSEKSPLLDAISAASPRGVAIIDELAAKAKPAQIAELQAKLKIAAKPGTPLEVIASQTKRELARQTLANELGQGLIKGGRQEVIKRLETLTGSRASALDIFKTLPEDVKGGIVLAGLSGKPLKKASGEYIRLTPGTGELLGPVGRAINSARLSAAGVLTPLTSKLERGGAGALYANVTKSLIKETEKLPGQDTLLDYNQFKEALRLKDAEMVRLSGATNAASAVAVDARNKAVKAGENIDEYDTAFNSAYLAPTAEFTAKNATEAAGLAAAKRLREAMVKAYQEGKDAGLSINELGNPDEFTSLILTKEAKDYLLRTERGRVNESDFDTSYGRKRQIEFQNDEELAKKAGFQSADNAGVVYRNPITANEAERSARGVDFNFYETDPVKHFATYSNSIARKIASKKFIDTLAKTGTVIRDVPSVTKLLSEWEAATFQAAATNLTPALKAEGARRVAGLDKQLQDLLDPTKLSELKAAVVKARDAANTKLAAARKLESDAVAEFKVADELYKSSIPNPNKITRRLTKYEKEAIATGRLAEETSSAFRRISAKLARLDLKKGVTEEWIPRLVKSLEDEIASTNNPAAKAVFRSYIKKAKLDLNETIDEIVNYTVDAEIAQIQRDTAKILQANVRADESLAQVRAVYDYSRAIEARDVAMAKLELAKRARRAAKDEADLAAAKFAFEEQAKVDTFVSSYITADKRARQYAIQSADDALELARVQKARIDSFRGQISPAEIARLEKLAAKSLATFRNVRKARVAELRSMANQQLATLRKTFGGLSSRFGNVASDYSDALIAATKDLSDTQFKAFQILRSEAKVQEYLLKIAAGSPDETAVQQAFGDMVSVFQDMRDVIPDSAWAALPKAQAELLDEASLAGLKTRLFRDKKTASEFGVALAENGYLVTGLNAATKDLFAASGMVKLMENIYQASANPSDFKLWLDDIIDPVLALWKTAVTIGRGPGYTATNLAGGLYMNYLGNVSLADTKLALDAISKVGSIRRQIEKANPNRTAYENLVAAEEATLAEFKKVKIADTDLGTLMKEFFDRGGFFETQIGTTAQIIAKQGTGTEAAAFTGGAIPATAYQREAVSTAEEKFRQSVDFLMTNRVQRGLNNMAQSSEMFLRLGAFIDGYRRYADFGSAMDKVHILHFNYRDLSEAEQWVRRLVPFYTWTRNNVPAQFRALMMQPGKIQRFMYANQEFQDKFGAEGDDSWINQVLPEYLNVSDGFASKFKFGDNNLGFFLKLPFEDINKLFKVGGNPVRLKEIANMLGPFTTPIELLSGTDLQTGQSFAPGGATAPGYLAPLAAVPGSGVYYDKEGVLRAPGALVKGIGDLIPALGTAERAAAAATAVPKLFGASYDAPNLLFSQKQEEAGLSSLLNLSGAAGILGVGTATVSPGAIGYEIKRRTDLQKADINKLAAQGGYDVDWIRTQLRNGVTPAQIAVMLAAGQGAIGTSEGPSKLTPQSRQKYSTAVQGL